MPESIGSLAQDLQGLVLGCKAVMLPLSYEMDLYTPPIPFREEMYNKLKGKKLKFGYYIDNGFFTPVPPMARAVKDTIAALKQDGHEVELWDISPYINEIVILWTKTVFADNGDTVRRMVQGDATDDAVQQLVQLLNTPRCILKLIAAIVRPFWPSMALVFANLEPINSVIDWWDHVEGVYEIRRKIVSDFESRKFDALISPGMGITPVPLYEFKNVLGHMFYTGFYNVLNWPAGTLPVTTIRKEDLEAPYPVRDLWHKAARNAMEGSEGLPANVQVVTLPYQDEICLQVMQTVQTAVQKYGQ